ncbi:hypothetical protein [Mycoplana rhizolycopersici]
MGRATDDFSLSDGMPSAVRRFPMQAERIRALIWRDDDFRSLCDDLAAAERALATVDRLPAELRDRRRTEFIDLIEGLFAEIEYALSEANVIRLSRMDHRLR